MTRPTQEELLELARRGQRGEVFFSWQLGEHDKDSLGMVFLPLLFMDEAGTKGLLDHGVEHLYGYMDQAMPRGVYGYPCFSGMGTLTKPEAHWVVEKMGEIQKAVDSVSA